MCSELTVSLFITDILIPNNGNIFETYVYDEAIRTVHYMLSKCPWCHLYIQSVQLLRAWSNHTCEGFRCKYDENGKTNNGKLPLAERSVWRNNSIILSSFRCGEAFFPLLTNTFLIFQFIYFFNKTSLKQTYNTNSSKVRIDRREYLHLKNFIKKPFKI